jgi:hypothetical protein
MQFSRHVRRLQLMIFGEKEIPDPRKGNNPAVTAHRSHD